MGKLTLNDDNKAVIDALHLAQTNGETVALATIVSTQGSIPRHAGSKLLIRADGSIVGTVGGGTMESRVIQAALDSLRDGKTRLETYRLNDIAAGDAGICGGSAQIFIEPVNTAPVLLVIGAGHCGAELAQLGKWLGYHVILSDDREEFCNADKLPGLDQYLVCKPGEVTDQISITENTYVAAVTRGLPVDINLVPALLKTPAAYIGIIGSKRRWALTVKALKEQHHLTEDDLIRIHAPIGLEIQAETPKEIAVSILAEIIMIRRGGTGKSMKWMGDVKEAEN